MDKSNAALESYKDIKGLYQTSYDYFKHLTTLSIASIGAILAFIVKIFPFPNLPILAVILVVISLLFLMVCLCSSLDGMTGSVNVSISITGMLMDILIEKDPDKLTSKVAESMGKLDKKTKKLEGYDKINKYAFILGIIFFVASACVSLISNKKAGGQVASSVWRFSTGSDDRPHQIDEGRTPYSHSFRLGSKMPAQHMNVPLQLHLKGASMFEPPKELLDFAHDHGAEYVVLVDDKDRCNTSVRSDRWLFINTRGTYWDNLILPPWNASTYSEAIILRFLHELGHASFNHKGDKALISLPGGLNIKRSNSPWEDALGKPQEFDAWLFALELRHKEPGKFSILINAYSEWALSHTFVDKDWDDTADLQFYRISGRNLSYQLFTIPEWVQEKFKKNAPHIPLYIKTR